MTPFRDSRAADDAAVLLRLDTLLKHFPGQVMDAADLGMLIDRPGQLQGVVALPDGLVGPMQKGVEGEHAGGQRRRRRRNGYRLGLVMGFFLNTVRRGGEGHSNS